MGKQTKYKILIKSLGIYYDLGTIIIKKIDGEFMYIPSQKDLLENDGNIKKKDHIFWHKTGRVHIKTINGEYKIREEGVGMEYPLKDIHKKRQSINKIGFQKILKDTIININTLPRYIKKIKTIDVVLNARDCVGPMQFNFSIVSGTHILECLNGGKTPVKMVSNKENNLFLDKKDRCLGCESGNADKLLQYGLYKYIGEKVRTGRMLFLSEDSGIYKKSDKQV